ncbi:hypothetical protein LCGC14_1556440 [marine sediment metagenome]|uniref:FCP1 homology domain-containing protein n=1 Tax=marine sediment metagenome TaxID=412755 RepID=A0A0F9LPN0_9ZZZZ
MFKLDWKEIHIFDIDGCIFPAKNGKGIHIMPTEFQSKTSREEIKNRMDKVELFPSFINFYKFVVNNIKHIKFYYITGRNKKNFQIITIEQLSILNTKNNRDTLIFFPDNIILTGKSYYKFKICHIIKIILENNGNSKINIYDDRFEYFDILKERLKDMKINNVDYHKVITPEYFWNIRYEEYNNLINIKQNSIKSDKND